MYLSLLNLHSLAHVSLQVFSDFAGVMFGGTVEAFASRLGLPLHGLTSEQLVMARTRKWSTLGAAIGVLVGCLIGMTQMLFMDLHREEQIQELEQIKVVVEEMLKDDAIKLHAERCVLYFVDHKERRVWTVVSEGGMGLAGERVYVDMSWDEGISGACVRSGKAYNIPNAYECDFFNPAYDKKSGGERFTKSVLALPVFVRGTEAIFAVLQFINKKEGDKIVEFNDEDVEVARQMAHYISMLRPALAPAVEKQQALHSTWIH